MKWSKGLSLTVEDVELRFKNWLELMPRVPDVDAISEKFFTVKGKNTAKKFNPGQGVDLILAISYEKYELAVTHSLAEDSEPVSCYAFEQLLKY